MLENCDAKNTSQFSITSKIEGCGIMKIRRAPLFHHLNYSSKVIGNIKRNGKFSEINSNITEMKVLIVIILVVASFASKISAQDSRSDLRTKLQFGLKFGTNYSNVFDTKGEDFKTDSKFGIVTGIFLKAPFGKYLGFQPEVLFSQKGFKTSGTLLSIPYRYTRTTSYIDVPLFVSVKPCGLITLLAGPQYSYLILERDVFVSTSLSDDQKKEFENNNLRKNTLSLIGGAEININHLIFGLRAGWDITNNNGNGTSTIPRYKNVWYQLTFGLKSYK